MNIISKIEFTSDDFPGADLVTLDITKEEIESLAQAKALVAKNSYHSIRIKVPLDAIALSQYSCLSSLPIDRAQFKVTERGVYFIFRSKLDSTAIYRTERLIIARELSEEVLAKLKQGFTDAFSDSDSTPSEYKWSSRILECIDKNGDPNILMNSIVSTLPINVAEKLVKLIQSLYI